MQINAILKKLPCLLIYQLLFILIQIPLFSINLFFINCEAFLWEGAF